MTRNGDKKLTDATLAEYETFYGKYHRPIQTGIKDKILKHLACKENNLHLEENQFEIYRLADISDAILHFLNSNKLAYEAVGLKANWYQGGGLAALLTGQIMEAPIVKARVKTGTSEEKAVFNDALFFAPGGRDQEPFVAMLSHSGQPGYNEEINIGLVMRNHKRAAAFASEFFSFVENRSTEKSIFRRKAVQPAISKNGCGIGGFSFIDFPAVEREQIILDKEIWEQLHRNLFLFYDKRKHLQGSNIALKRGILLSGEPGTGKTLLCQHIVSKFSDYTTIYVPSITAVAIGAIVNMAKRLQPALLILEDVDLVAQDRIHQVGSAKSVLGELMNQMEGFSSADDIVFFIYNQQSSGDRTCHHSAARAHRPHH